MFLSESWKAIRSGRFLYDRRVALATWFGLSLFAVIRVLLRGEINIYLIYKYSIFHLLEHKNLYPAYPEYNDLFMYGPVFTLLIAPFAWLPNGLAVFLWVAFNCIMLFWAIRKLPVNPKWQLAVLVCCSHELMNHSAWLQVNALVCSFIILAFSYVKEGKEGRALFLIMLGAFIKAYSIVGLVFFLFSNRKTAFIGWAIVWSVFFFLAPLALVPFDYLIQCYRDWAMALQSKNAMDIDLRKVYWMHDISAMGIIRRATGYNGLRDIWVLGPAAILFLTQLALFKHWKEVRFQLYILCSVLLFAVVFSSGAESPTYIIALPGICIWYFIQPKTKLVTGYFVFALLLTTFAYSDLFTPWLRIHVLRPYSLKALPSFITWIIILVQIHRRQFLKALDPAAGPRHAPLNEAHA